MTPRIRHPPLRGAVRNVILPEISMFTEKPEIRLLADDLLRLYPLTDAALEKGSEAAQLLNEELSRGHISPLADDEVVCMGATVEFEEHDTGVRRTVTLVYPGEADVEQGRISILTPIGATLIGLSPGQAMAWRTRGGVEKRLKVLSVTPPPPKARAPRWSRTLGQAS